jgi:uncharacterized protein (TIGR04255 family)
MAYRSPPITEAVFDVQFDEAFSEADVRRIARSFAGSYPKADETIEFSFEFTPHDTKTNRRFAGLRLTNNSGDELVIINLAELSSNRLAPYLGWDQFEARSWSNFLAFKKVAGFRKARRAALRFLNRIDVPGAEVDFSNYVQLGPGLPREIEADGYGSFSSFVYADTKVILNYGTVVSPLIGHRSYSIDIDVFVDEDVPQKEADLRELFQVLRRRMNELFELLITERSRALFGK